MTTFAEMSNISKVDCTHKDVPDEVVTTSLFSWIIGTLLIFLSLVGVAFLGYLQKRVYIKYEVPPSENIFYSHLLPIPMFFLFYNNLKEHFMIWNASKIYNILGLQVPSLWVLCVLNVITQYICSIGVHNTTMRMGTLTCTFATTIRKFLTLLFSVLYFGNPFTTSHWIGSTLVFLGAALYTNVTNAIKSKQN